MSPKQRAHYFTRLWPAACTAQGWSAKDEAMRRDVTFETTGQTSSSGLTQEQITALFRFLEFLADPLNVAKAILVTSGDVAQEQNRQRQLVHVIEQQGFEEAYVARCADGLCAAEGLDASWRDLSSDSLLKLSFTVKTRARKRDAETGKRPDFIPRKQAWHRRPETKKKKADKKAIEREQPVVPRPGITVDADLPPF